MPPRRAKPTIILAGGRGGNQSNDVITWNADRSAARTTHAQTGSRTKFFYCSNEKRKYASQKKQTNMYIGLQVIHVYLDLLVYVSE